MLKSKLPPALILICALLAPFGALTADTETNNESTLSLITESVEDGFQLAIHFQTIAAANDYWRTKGKNKECPSDDN